MTDADDALAAIASARADAERLIASLGGRMQQILDGSALSADDDEHDPEGATVAFERAQVGATLAAAKDELAELDRAADRVAAGTYWQCSVCGGPIAGERLAARPAARTCIECARKADR